MKLSTNFQHQLYCPTSLTNLTWVGITNFNTFLLNTHFIATYGQDTFAIKQLRHFKIILSMLCVPIQTVSDFFAEKKIEIFAKV